MAHSRPRFIRFISALAIVSPGFLFLGGQANASLYPAGPPRYPSFVTAMCPPELAGPLKDAPNAIGGGKTVALTFDDGPGVSTGPIIDVLQKYHIRASFMNVDTHFPQYLTQEFNDGYLMGNHSGNHHLLTGLSLGLQLAEIDRSIQKTYGVTKTAACVFRPPYGGYDATTVKASALRNSGMWMWNDGTGDFLAMGSDSAYWSKHIYSSALGVGLKIDHPTILLHDQPHPMPADVAALPTIIEKFQNAGYTFVDLLGRSGAPNTCPGTPPAPYGTAGTSLLGGASLASGSSITSPNGEFTLTMNVDGNLQIRLSKGRVLWSSNTSGHSGAVAEMSSNGVLQVVDGGTTLWSSGNGDGATKAVLGNNGNLVTMNGVTATWSSKSILTQLHSGDHLQEGWGVYSPSGLCELSQMSTGALTLHSPNGMVIWTNGVSTKNPVTTLSPSGSLVTTGPTGEVWGSEMNFPNDTVGITDTGHAEFRSAGGKLFFVTP